MNEEENDIPNDVDQIDEPTKPSNPLKRLKTSGKTVVNKTFSFVRGARKFFSSPLIPKSVKIIVIAVILLAIIVVLILETEAEENSEVVESVVNRYSIASGVDEDAALLFNDKSSLLLYSLKDINDMYEEFKSGNELASITLENFDYLLGTKALKDGGDYDLSKDIQNLARKAVAMAQKNNLEYSETARDMPYTLLQIDKMKRTDSSGLLWSLFKVYLNVDIGINTEQIYEKAKNGHSENNWTAEVKEIGNGAELQAGDILYREGHVGLYVGQFGTANHVDFEGTEKGPNSTNYDSKGTPYTHYIRYTNPNAKNIVTEDYYNPSDGSNPSNDSTNSDVQIGASSISEEIRDASSSEKLKYLFGGKVPTSKEQMSPYLTTIEVDVIEKNGYRTTTTLTVHKALAEDVKNIYKEIADSGFIVYSTYAYNWRAMASNSEKQSHHSYGVAIDINPEENYMITKSGKIISGKLWDPKNNKYSIPTNSTVVKAFEARGWIWGGKWKSSKDYMHFSFTGN